MSLLPHYAESGPADAHSAVGIPSCRLVVTAPAGLAGHALAMGTRDARMPVGGGRSEVPACFPGHAAIAHAARHCRPVGEIDGHRLFLRQP